MRSRSIPWAQVSRHFKGPSEKTFIMNLCFQNGVVPILRLDLFLRLCDALFCSPGDLLDGLLEEGLTVHTAKYQKTKERAELAYKRRQQINDLMRSVVRRCEDLFVVLVREIRDENSAHALRAMLWELMTLLPDMTTMAKKAELQDTDWQQVIAYFKEITIEVEKAKCFIVPLARERVDRLLETTKQGLLQLEKYKAEDKELDLEREAKNEWASTIRAEQRKAKRPSVPLWDLPWYNEE